MRFCTIDPGKTGAIIYIDTDTKLGSYSPLYYDRNNILQMDKFEQFIETNRPNMVFIEKVSGRGGWGANVNFTFGSVFGQIVLACKTLDKPIQLVPPKTWQKIVHSGTPSNLDAKEKSNLAYTNFFPISPVTNKSKKVHSGAMDAILIALYVCQKYKIDHHDWVITKHEYYNED